ncbi:uncharacterized protein LOC143693546 [Agelaius phoeniceus]|uniref:uncharacterized protein LOC143693546 n=1 Tax=Agelaius phoeniceus TaxID=39638 RepID=UPI004054C8FA
MGDMKHFVSSVYQKRLSRELIMMVKELPWKKNIRPYDFVYLNGNLAQPMKNLCKLQYSFRNCLLQISVILMHLLKPGSCLRKRETSARIADKIPSTFDSI